MKQTPQIPPSRGRRTTLATGVGASFLTLAVALTAATPASAAGAVTSLRGTTADALATAIAGTGVTVSAAAFTGTGVQGASFDGIDLGQAGLESGVAISTGSLIPADPTADSDVDFTRSALLGPNVGLTTTGDFGTPGDADLDALGGSTTYDAAVLSFTVVPAGNDLTLSYLLGSEEYAGWSEQNYADAFGIWVGDELCSVVPGSDDPVSTTTISPTANTGLYNSNVDGDDPGTAFDTEFNGFTDALECVAEVVAGQPVGVKIAVADTRDGQLDTTVLIAASSLVSTPLPGTEPEPEPEPGTDPAGTPGANQRLGFTGAGAAFSPLVGVGLLLAGGIAVGATILVRRRLGLDGTGPLGNSEG